MSIYNNTDNIHPPICCRYETVLQILNTMLCKRRDVMIISAFISSPCSSNICNSYIHHFTMLCVITKRASPLNSPSSIVFIVTDALATSTSTS